MLFQYKNQYFAYHSKERVIVMQIYDNRVVVDWEKLEGKIPEREFNNLFDLLNPLPVKLDGDRRDYFKVNPIIIYGIEAMLEDYVV